MSKDNELGNQDISHYSILDHHGVPTFGRMSYFAPNLLMPCGVREGTNTLAFANKMVITGASDEDDRGSQEKESKEESILAMLGIIGTILNLIVIIFVYIYTTL
ncbi:protein TUNAR [Pelodytes ibericus]